MVTVGPKRIPLTGHLLKSWFLAMLRFVWYRQRDIVLTAIAFLPIFILNWFAGYIQTSTDIPNTAFSRQDVAEGLATLANGLLTIQIVVVAGILVFIGGRTSGRR